MSIASVLDGAVLLLQGNVPALLTVQSARGVEEFAFTPDRMPGALLMDRADSLRETAVAMNVDASEWDLVVHVFGAYNPDDASSEATFQSLVEVVRNTFRTNKRLGGLGDTSTSNVSIAFAHDASTSPPELNENSYLLRHASVTVHIRELVNA